MLVLLYASIATVFKEALVKLFAKTLYSNQTNTRHSGEDRNPCIAKPQNIQRPYNTQGSVYSL